MDMLQKKAAGPFLRMCPCCWWFKLLSQWFLCQ